MSKPVERPTSNPNISTPKPKVPKNPIEPKVPVKKVPEVTPKPEKPEVQEPKPEKPEVQEPVNNSEPVEKESELQDDKPERTKLNYELLNINKLDLRFKDVNRIANIMRLRYEKTKNQNDKMQMYQAFDDVLSVLKRYETFLNTYIEHREEELKELSSDDFINSVVTKGV